MSIFKKAVKLPQVISVNLNEGDDAALLRFVGEFEQGQLVHDDAQVRTALLGIGTAGGGPRDLLTAVNNQEKFGESGSQMPFRWIRAIAERMPPSEIRALSHIALFVLFYVELISPQLVTADEIELRMSASIDPEIEFGILTATKNGVFGLSPDEILLNDPEDSLTMETVQSLWSRRMEQLQSQIKE